MESVTGFMMWMFRPTEDPLRFMITLAILLVQKALLGGVTAYVASRKGRNTVWFGVSGALFFTFTLISLVFLKPTQTMTEEDRKKAVEFDREFCSLPISVGALVLGIWLITSLAKVNSGS
jgi:heme A synthase